jgi:hypothetical protein
LEGGCIEFSADILKTG